MASSLDALLTSLTRGLCQPCSNEFHSKVCLDMSAADGCALCQAITVRALDQYYHLEEDCLVKKADVSKLLQRIQVGRISFPFYVPILQLSVSLIPLGLYKTGAGQQLGQPDRFRVEAVTGCSTQPEIHLDSTPCLLLLISEGIAGMV